MKVLLFGATGMVGQGVLRECLLDERVTQVISIGRSVTGQQHAKLVELQHEQLFDLSALAPQLTNVDACLFCLGVSSAGMSEQKYRHITYDLTLSIARELSIYSPQLTFVYVTGSGTDSTEQGKTMWARVKGKTENDLLKLPFKAAYMFRPGAIIPLHGVKSKTKLYQLAYDVTRPLFGWLQRKFPHQVTTTECVGQAMINAVAYGYSSAILEPQDINELAKIKA